jgi:cysteinyl-tRNA synthetase
MLKIYNSATQKKEIFEPVAPPTVGMYVCGPTVYDYYHIGNARVFVFFDVVARYLQSQGYQVKYIRNITDVDDKIIERASNTNIEVTELTTKFTDAMHEDSAKLNILSPTIEPKATEHISDIISMIEKLVSEGFAYVATNGDVYYEVNKFTDYGKLAKQNLDELQSGARIEVADVKKNPLDFVLWKLAKPSEPAWDSPWGKGRPGWHSECAAMSMRYLGKRVDIHGGGIDLVFPHHQNEIAQAEAVTHGKFVNNWMHVGYVQVAKEKMSKSLGNFFLVRDVLQKYDAETIRYFLLSNHYRSPIDYSPESLASAKAALTRFYLALRDVPLIEFSMNEALQNYKAAFITAMDDDFNIPEALAVLFEMTREINRLRDSNDMNNAANIAALLRDLADILGLLKQDAGKFLQSDLDMATVTAIEDLIAQRASARKNKNWAEADKIRNQLKKMGIEIEDTPEKTIWRKT